MTADAAETPTVAGQQSPPLDAAARLRQIHDRLSERRPLTPEQTDFLQSALRRFLQGSRLDDAFGVRPKRGRGHPARALRLRERDDLIRALAENYGGAPAQKARAVVRVVRGEAEASDDQARALVELLKQFDLPDARQLARIVRPARHEIDIWCRASSVFNIRP